MDKPLVLTMASHYTQIPLQRRRHDLHTRRVCFAAAATAIAAASLDGAAEERRFLGAWGTSWMGHVINEKSLNHNQVVLLSLISWTTGINCQVWRMSL